MGALVSWEVAGLYFDVCNCESVCPCYSGRPPTYGFCDGTGLWHIDQGWYGDVALNDLNVIIVVRCDGHMRETTWKCRFYIDDRATNEQFDAMKQIFTAADGGHLAKVFSSLWDVKSVESAKIDAKIEGWRVRASIPRKLGLSISVFKPEAGPALCRIPNVPGIAAITDEYWFADGEMKFDHRNKNAMATTFEYHSDR
jgi:hypothetical protein